MSERLRIAIASPLLWLAVGVSAQVTLPTSLRSAISEALLGNPEIQAAKKEEEAARARISPAGSLDDPMLEAGIINLPAESRRFDREDMTMKMVGLSQRIPYPGKRRLREDVATSEADAVRHGLRETVNRVTRDVKVAYLDLALGLESIRLTEKNKRVLEQFLQTAEARYAVGQSTQADVLKAQTQLAKMTDELLKLERERRNVEAELGRAVGRNSATFILIPEMPSLKSPDLQVDALRNEALTNRPQLMALRSTLVRNEQALQLARKDYSPDFDVRLAYGQRDRSPSGSRREDMVSITVAINLPIWGANKLAPRVVEAAAMRDRASSMLQQQQNELESRLRQELANVEQSAASARLYESTVLPQAKLTVESSLAAYRVNRVDFLTLLDNQMTVLNYELALATSVVRQNKSLAEIEFIAGREPF